MNTRSGACRYLYEKMVHYSADIAHKTQEKLKFAKPIGGFLAMPGYLSPLRFHLPPEKNKINVQLLKDAVRTPIQLYLPAAGIKGPTDRIFDEQAQGKLAHHKVERDIQVLTRYRGALDRYLTREEFFNAHPKSLKFWSQTIKLFSLIQKLALALPVALGIDLLTHSKSLLSFEEFGTNPVHRLKDDEVALLVETCPYPHTAIAIGDRVYSFGRTRLQVFPLAQYLKQHEFNEYFTQVKKMWQERSSLPLEERLAFEKYVKENFAEQKLETTNDASEKGSLQKSFDWAYENNFLCKDRSIQVLVLALGKDRVAEIARKLENNRGINYPNETLVNDCSTESLKTLGLENFLYDAYPGTALNILHAQGKLGLAPVPVRRLLQLSESPDVNGKLRVARNYAVNAIEAGVWSSPLYSLPKMLKRVTKEQTGETLQEWSPAVVEEKNDLKEKWIRDMFQEQEYQFLLQKAEQIAKEENNNEQTNLKKESLLFLLKVLEDKLKSSAVADIQERQVTTDKLLAEARLGSLQRLKNRIHSELKLNSK